MKNNVLKIILWGDEVGKIYWDSKNMTSIFNYNPDFVKKGLDIAPFTKRKNLYGSSFFFNGSPTIRTLSCDNIHR